MEVATIKGATHNPGAPRGWTEANGPCGALPIIYRKDSHGNPESVSAFKPTAEELRQLNEGGFVILSVIGWQVPVCLYTADKDAAVASEDLLKKLLAEREHKRIFDKICGSNPAKLTLKEWLTFNALSDPDYFFQVTAGQCHTTPEVVRAAADGSKSYVMVRATFSRALDDDRHNTGMITIDGYDIHLDDGLPAHSPVQGG